MSEAGPELSGPTVPKPSGGLSRRGFVGAAGIGAGALGGLMAGASPARAVTNTEVNARAVVVGTGFGGGVTALRLAEAGVPTLVLERGLRWQTGPNSNTFATLANLDNRSAWLSPKPSLPSLASLVPGANQTWPLYTGVLEVIKGNNMTVNCGACVGGGSVMYHGMTLQPTKADFVRSMPMAAGLYDELDAGAPPLLAGIRRLMTVVGFGIVPAVGTWTYDAGKDDAVLNWPSGADAALQVLIAARMAGLALAGGGLMIDTNLTENSTWHALGGVPMGSATDLFGRIIGHRGLYVLDGARIPGSTGACNPSMTIAALAEHSMARIVPQDVGAVF